MSNNKILIITQQDYFFIPKNIKKIIDNFGYTNIVSIIQIDNKSSINNKRLYFIKGFGLIQSVKYGLYFFFKKIMNFFSIFFTIFESESSIKTLCKIYKIPFKKTSDINNDYIINHLKDLSIDIIISFSAPTVFKRRLLTIPRLGCINLHCSYLPFYSGLFPSFWVINNNEEFTGCTIHYMDNKIDNGAILKQKKVPVNSRDTIFSLLSKTKNIGGNLMVEVLKELFQGKIKTKPNEVNSDYYFTWPTIEQIKQFRYNGKKLI